MPFTPEWTKAVYNAIKYACRERKISVTRADELHGVWVMRDIWTSILKADFIIADVTGRNPNVFYELGIAHTIGRKTIILSQNPDDIPFDVVGMRKIIYEWNDPQNFPSLLIRLTEYLEAITSTPFE